MWKKALEKYRPRLCALIHASNVTGAVNDAETLTAMAKAAGAAMLLDISQSLGWISVKLEKWGVDMAAFTGHKYLLGPQGTGGLYVRPGLTLRPYVLGGTGVKSDLRKCRKKCLSIWRQAPGTSLHTTAFWQLCGGRRKIL